MLENRINISDSIYKALKEDIISGKLSFGARLIESHYAQQFNISRTPLREAIKKLEVEGIVERLPNGRLQIINITPTHIREIYNIRIALENFLLESSIEHTEIFPTLEIILQTNHQQIKNKDWIGARESLKLFSEALYQNIQHEFTLKILKQYSFFLANFKNKSIYQPQRIIQAYSDHCEMFESIKNKDINRLKEINTKHIKDAMETVMKV